MNRRSYLREDNPHWKGGKADLGNGYTYCLSPDHPMAEVKGYVSEALLVVEKALGRILFRKIIIHHVDGDITNNSKGNLVVCEDRAYHNLLHQRIRALKACGYASWRKCWICKEYSDPANSDLVFGTYKRGQMTPYHRSCLNEYNRKRWRKNHGKQ